MVGPVEEPGAASGFATLGVRGIRGALGPASAPPDALGVTLIFGGAGGLGGTGGSMLLRIVTSPSLVAT